MDIMSFFFNTNMPLVNEHIPRFDVIYHIKNTSMSEKSKKEYRAGCVILEHYQ